MAARKKSRSEGVLLAGGMTPVAHPDNRTWEGPGVAPPVADGGWADLPEWITIEEAAQQSGYHPEYVRRLARQRRIGAEKKGRDWWVDRDAFRAYLDLMKDLGSRKHISRGPNIPDRQPSSDQAG